MLLKPCPLCGSDNIQVAVRKVFAPTGRLWSTRSVTCPMVQCVECGCNVYADKTEVEVKAIWNTRRG